MWGCMERISYREVATSGSVYCSNEEALTVLLMYKWVKGWVKFNRDLHSEADMLVKIRNLDKHLYNWKDYVTKKSVHYRAAITYLVTPGKYNFVILLICYKIPRLRPYFGFTIFLCCRILPVSKRSKGRKLVVFQNVNKMMKLFLPGKAKSWPL